MAIVNFHQNTDTSISFTVSMCNTHFIIIIYNHHPNSKRPNNVPAECYIDNDNDNSIILQFCLPND